MEGDGLRLTPRPCRGADSRPLLPFWQPGHHRRHPHTQTRHAQAGRAQEHGEGGARCQDAGKRKVLEQVASLLPPLPCCPAAGGGLGPRGWALVTQEVGGARRGASGARESPLGVRGSSTAPSPGPPSSSQLPGRDWAAGAVGNQKRGLELSPQSGAELVVSLAAGIASCPLTVSIRTGTGPEGGAVWPQGPLAPGTVYPGLLCWAEETGVSPLYCLGGNSGRSPWKLPDGGGGALPQGAAPHLPSLGQSLQG